VPMAPPLLDRKVQVFTQRRQAAQRKRVDQLTLPRKKAASGDVAVISPRGAKLSPWHLNPVHSIGHGLSAAPVATLSDQATYCHRCR
jgi:hypothetical protein